ncbi:type II toxin-antitoxin system RelE/ParE family toxin [Planktotalea arctica]|uniref:type II toxin-antitoxin system RelE/ParE family toxin n=1 Tax=Planktotalea arctica TaxID=1481893 RepID=UPI003D2F74FE
MPDLKLSISRTAQSDLRGIWQYTAKTWSIDQADTYLRDLQSKFDMLCETPLIATEYSKFSPPIRVLRSGRHLILCNIKEDKLRILRIMHTSQDWMNILS